MQRNVKRTTNTFLFISHTTNVLLFKFRCNILIGVRIIKEMPGTVTSGTPCIMGSLLVFYWHQTQKIIWLNSFKIFKIFLQVFENRVLVEIFGPKRDEVTGDWRKLHNEELNGLYFLNEVIPLCIHQFILPLYITVNTTTIKYNANATCFDLQQSSSG